VGLLNADYVLVHDRFLVQVKLTLQLENINSCHADLVYLDQNSNNSLLRYWRPNDYDKGSARLDWMSPHPIIYLKKPSLVRIGLYRVHIGPQADLEYCA